MDGHLWKYEGTVDASGKVLRSYLQGDDGKWVQFMMMNARRK
jgi:hypothetical protein